MSSLCIDMGATKVYLGIADVEFNDIIKKNTKDFLENSNNILKNIKNDHNIENTAIALPGPLDLKNDLIYPPNIQSQKIDIKDLFKDYFSNPKLINDCHAGVIGEYLYGDNKSNDIVYLTISTGIGAGVISSGELIKGWDGNFAEVGHMLLSGDRRCGCGGKGHWEAYCSGNNIVEYAEEITQESFQNAEHLFKEFKSGNKKAVKVIKKFQKINAKGISNIINLYNPEIIIIGGSIAANNPEAIIGNNMNVINDNIVNPMPKIKITSLDNYSVLHGLKAICQGEFNYKQ